jgi:hypothetical protein
MGSFTNLGLHSGILNQSQAYGYLMAILLVFQLFNFKSTSYKKWDLIVIFGSVFFTFLSKSRTAYFAILADFLVLGFIYRGFPKLRLFLSVSFIFLLIYILTINNDFIQNLLNKRNSEINYEISSFDEMLMSRNQLASPSLDNFYNYPAFGIGMGVPTEMTNVHYDISDRWGVAYIPYTKIIISFPVEKGVQYTAILEELGIFGMVIFIFLVLSFWPNMNQNNYFYSVLAILTILIISIGEASFFSPNGLGFFALLLFVFSKGFNLDYGKA